MSDFVKVFISKIPQNYRLTPIDIVWRQNEIESVSNEKIKIQKHCAWKLLEFAISQVLGCSISSCNVHKESSGKVVADGFYISISHSTEYVVVALSNKRVGIDIERYIDNPKVSKKILHNSEQNLLKSGYINEKLTLLWTKKESIFKSSNDNYFVPSNIETSKFNTISYEFGNNGDYIISISTDFLALDIYEVKDIASEDYTEIDLKEIKL